MNSSAKTQICKYFFKTLLCLGASVSLYLAQHLLFSVVVFCFVLVFGSSHLDGCAVVAFYFHPAFIVVLDRGVGLKKAILSRLEVEMRELHLE